MNNRAQLDFFTELPPMAMLLGVLGLIIGAVVAKAYTGGTLNGEPLFNSGQRVIYTIASGLLCAGVGGVIGWKMSE